jgi:hypothetical protein
MHRIQDPDPQHCKILLARSYAAENTKRKFTETQHDRITGGGSKIFHMNDVNLLNFGN